MTVLSKTELPYATDPLSLRLFICSHNTYFLLMHVYTFYLFRLTMHSIRTGILICFVHFP